MYNPDYLCHYGVQGMRWGQRKINRMTKKLNRRLSDQNRFISTMQYQSNKNWDAAIRNKVDKKTIEKARAADVAWSKALQEVMTTKISNHPIASKEDYQKVRKLIDNIGKKHLKEFDDKYGINQSYDYVRAG